LGLSETTLAKGSGNDAKYHSTEVAL